MEEIQEKDEIHDCQIKLRVDPIKRRDTVYIGSGAGFKDDRPKAALKLLQSVQELNYLVLECLSERTLAERYRAMLAGGDGYESRISEWMMLLLPLAVEKGTCIITNMGAMDPIGAQKNVMDTASNLGLDIVVAVGHEVEFKDSGPGTPANLSYVKEGGIRTYLGAAPIVRSLELYNPNVIITSRVADSALYLAPMIYELGWNWDEMDKLAQGAMAGHLVECGCQLTGGYFMHPGDKHRDMSFAHLLDLSLPYAEVSHEGQVCVAKANGSGGVLNFRTCAEQLMNQISDPSCYITPDVVLDIRDVQFTPLSSDKVLCTGAKASLVIPAPERLLQLVPKGCGWKGWGEVSFGGHECVKRAKAADYLVRAWIEESYPGISSCVMSYIIGLDSLKAANNQLTSVEADCRDIRLRMDGLFELREHAIQFTNDFKALITNGPAGAGGVSTGYREEVFFQKPLVGRDSVFWRTGAKSTSTCVSKKEKHLLSPVQKNTFSDYENLEAVSYADAPSPAPSGKKIPLYQVAHGRTGDRNNNINFSIIPHFPLDIERLKVLITSEWVKKVITPLMNPYSFPNLDAIKTRDEWVEENVRVDIYELCGIHSLNVVVHNILDGGTNRNRRIDRNGRAISDVILSQYVVLP